MKRHILMLFVLLMAGFTLNAQLETPRPSPMCKMEQTVGLTDIKLEYSRPGVKDRTIFGGLLSYGDMWRVGANASTKISFSDDVEIMGNELAAGKYALYMTPKEDKWEVIFYTNTEHWGTPGGDFTEDNVAVRVQVAPQNLSEQVETMLLDINEIRNSSAELQLRWANTLVAVPFTVPTHEKVKKNINQVMSGPSARDYYNAAEYYYDEDMELAQALTWMNKAVEMEEGNRFFYWLLKSDIEASLNQYDDAIDSAKKAKKMAMEDGAEGYVKRIEKKIQMFKEEM